MNSVPVAWLTLAAIIGSIILSLVKWRADGERHRWQEEEQRKATSLAELTVQTARELARVTAETAKSLTAGLEENTRISQAAKDGAVQAYQEANDVNQKIETRHRSQRDQYPSGTTSGASLK